MNTKMDKKTTQNLIRFLSEIYMLKRNRHEGFRLAGVDDPTSLSEHIAFAAQIAYLIGELEGLDGNKCAALVLFHDNGEARISDQHKVAARYIDNQKAERAALTEQVERLPKKLAQRILSFYDQVEKRHTPEGIVAKDADWIEAALQAKIYAEQGYDIGHWVDNVTRAVETETAKTIMAEIKKTARLVI